MGANPKDWIEISDATSLPDKPVLSVIMTTYNHGPCLAEAIEGVDAADGLPDRAADRRGLEVSEFFPGHWRGIAYPQFQDVYVLRKV